MLRLCFWVHLVVAGAVIAAPSSADAAAEPGDALIASGTAVYDFTDGGNLAAAQPFASVAAEIFGLCVGPARHLYVSTTAGTIYDVTAGGSFAGTTPFASVPGQAISLACNETQIRVLANNQVFDVTSGATNVFATDLVNGSELVYGVGGHLFLMRFDGVMDIHAGGSMAGQPLHVSGGGFPDALIGGGADATRMLAAGFFGNVYDVTAAGTLGAPFATGIGQAADILITPSRVFTWSNSADAIFDVTAGGDMSMATPHATGLVGPNRGAMVYVPGCGDGYVQSGESCDGDDDGTSGETAVCNANCTAADCGDSILNTSAGETCDPGSETAACDSDCTSAVCGDDVLNTTAGEACEDGNTTAGDGCDASCQEESTGPGGGGGMGGAGGEGAEGGEGGEGGMGTGAGGTGGNGTGGTAGNGSGGNDEQPEGICAPGQQIACACPGGEDGAQPCNADGTGYDTCECPPITSVIDESCSAAPPGSRSSIPTALLGTLLALGLTRLRRSSFGPKRS